MKQERSDELEAYYREAGSWAADKQQQAVSSIRLAWIVAGVAVIVALAEAVALAMLAPLKTVEPYTLLVDRQTGYVEALKPIERQTIAPDAALTRSFLAQYVIAREGFDIGSLRSDYQKAALWSAPDVRAAYVASMQAGNPESPLAKLPRGAVVEVAVKSVSSLGPDTSLVRFETRRADAEGHAQLPAEWAAVISYKYSGKPMTVADRLVNPLGFEVTRYRKDSETLPPDAATPAADTAKGATATPEPTVAPAPPPSRVPVRPSPDDL